VNRNPAGIIIPAHNEEAVIVRTLTSLLKDAMPGEFSVTVLCNGCTDRTAALVRQHFATVNVMEISEASKTAAINAGLRAARDADVILLDADIEISAKAVRALLGALAAPGVEAAIGHMHIDVEGASWPVRAFYRVWARHPYLSNGKFAAVIALSQEAVERIGQLPGVIADDTYLWRQFAPENIAVVDNVSFTARVPRTLSALIRVRSRVHRGNRELDRLSPQQSRPKRQRRLSLLRALLRHPATWASLPWFVAVSVAARLLAITGQQTWNRDLTSRQPLGQRQPE
jgi:glycosyltransferase involved in cell wall biosynthesis